MELRQLVAFVAVADDRADDTQPRSGRRIYPFGPFD
jgi:hypothetical protein